MKVEKEYKFFLYLRGYYNSIFANYKEYLSKKEYLLSKLSDEEISMCYDRKQYYNKDNFSFRDISSEYTIDDLRNIKSPTSYYIDTFEYARYFDKNYPIRFVFGDVDFVPKEHAIVKSRPIGNDNGKGILLNLDRQRHFKFIKNDIAYAQKNDILIGRLSIRKQHRIEFFKKHFNNPNVDIGHVKKNGENAQWFKDRLSYKEHLNYKYILSLEGYDVATNLKWIMSSNSIAVSPKLKFETWFMEGKLRGGEHYIEIADDYSDLDEKLDFYLNNPKEALEIIHNANEYVKKFRNKYMEELVSILVLESLYIS
ncbi:MULTISPECIES: glycosyl transferase family 90 [Flavobacterium]|uniref:Lipopolysaccharide biosynthesis protein n=1 Tax=Flavobacterium lipolyticum TaxID=2893754 RepID=A0ABS8M133_9FLAO|nr:MULTISPECIES: glycosyl transferase family 90 [unclassified Flavobacterium]MCC9018379.1 lipopolysaccharide biosynthesis protein [Flavobacterium sp. F-126]